ncbi:Na(+)-translocating NADH-quinone reductase subunit D [Aedoeadaptatus ivorii]|uniref:Ion-translocating oxidoreductase complex subunit E n=1 Tax=Aedoeadaptatus ivorii TaxID=54006 RepID=A0A3S5AJ17_9FIRM|nr:electron transport complex subunit RsxE [Peptoniphilus ivorii]MDQ0507655.1 electron transport complex protein RnfE [Peptoniphilus ivorii]VEJ35345.1 Na(+)-translocating NADH-quinone reductase subunit D [Peptoniphilus ivorii]
MSLGKVFTNSIFKNNPIFIQMIGLCSVLAITTQVSSAIAMGVAVTFVLICSNAVVSILRNVIPENVRIPAFIVVIATFVTLVEMVLHAYMPAIYAALGIFLPLIVVNCCILGEAEGFAYQNKLVPSIVDGLGTGIGYSIAVLAMAIVRELFGSGTLLGMQVFPESYPGIGVLISPAGAFILLGLYIAAYRSFMAKRA